MTTPNDPTPTAIDLNADLGESFGQWAMGADEQMLDIVSSANIACGFHAGDPLVMRRTLAAAIERGVSIGAHVAYRDLAGFGRRYIDMDPAELEADVLYQLAALDGMAGSLGGQVSYVKPHGALYHAIVRDAAQASAVVQAIAGYNGELGVLGLPGSLFLTKAEDAGLTATAESFADRNYNPDGTLVSRRLPDAVLHDADLVGDRMVTLVTDGHLQAVGGQSVRIDAGSICIHGDSPDAVAMARAVRERLTAAGITIRAFSAGRTAQDA